MALDLFFVPRNQDYADARKDGFAASDTQLRARRKLLKAIAGQYDGAAIGGKATDGTVADFPLGILVAYPGYLHWSLHGVDAREPVEAVVEWFHAQGLVCEDPQDAGFANRARSAGRQNLRNWEDLVGARLLAIEVSDPGVTGLILHWTLPDGREAQLAFIHHQRCEVPVNLTPLIRDTLAEIVIEPADTHTIGGKPVVLNENFRFLFASGAQIGCYGAVVKSLFAQPAGKPKW